MAENLPAPSLSPVALSADGTPVQSGLPERFRRYADYLAVEAAAQKWASDPKLAERLRAETWGHADALAGPSPTPVERTLAEAAAVSWLHVRVAEWRADRADNPTLAQAAWCQRRIDHAHRRFLSALRTLATVRKLAVPTLQLNIGAHQVNVGG